MHHELILILDFRWQDAVSYRAISLFVFLLFSSACSENFLVKNPLAGPTPWPEAEIPSDWVTFNAGRLRFFGPTDLKKKDVRGDDSELHEYEDREFSIRIEIGNFADVDGSGFHFYESETGRMLVEGRSVGFVKADVNRPAPGAARNADGSRAKPVEKNLVLQTGFPKESATVTVSYASESSTMTAMKILQSFRTN